MNRTFFTAIIVLTYLGTYASVCDGQTNVPTADELASRGDLNRDGVTDVLDVQATIGQALGAMALTAEADVDGNSGVDIFDVQHLINSALNRGGLVQRVFGVVDCDCDLAELAIVALSREGRRVIAEVNPDTGAFELLLRTRTSWAMGLCGRRDGEESFHCIGRIAFPIGDRFSSSLPLIDLSHGRELGLGTLRPEDGRIVVEDDLLDLLGRIDRPFDRSDRNEDGIPDFAESLIRRVDSFDGYPDGFEIGELLRRIAACAGQVELEDVAPSLADRDGNEIPDFIERSFLPCVESALDVYLRELLGPNNADAMRIAERVRRHVIEGVSEWLARLDHPLLRDENENGAPDFIEPFLIRSEGISTELDRDGNLTPDFLEDHDGDGVPNYLDEDFRNRPGVRDRDGDGIEDDVDVDDDNDGRPDYADPSLTEAVNR